MYVVMLACIKSLLVIYTSSLLQLFTTIGQENCGKVTVFFCGSPQLGHVVQQKCHEHGFGFRKENF